LPVFDGLSKVTKRPARVPVYRVTHTWGFHSGRIFKCCLISPVDEIFFHAFERQKSSWRDEKMAPTSDMPEEFVAAFRTAPTPDAKRAVIECAILRLLLAAHPGSCEADVYNAVRCPPAATTVQWVDEALSFLETRAAE
jgi:hypothetical protein